jgi:hypothetical protein
MLGARPSHWSEYLELLRWLAPDVFRHARGKMIRVLALSGIGVGLRAASAAVIVLFVDAQQKGRSAEVLGFALPSEPTLANLALWGGAGLLFTVGAVGASYRCDRLIYALARTYVEDWSRVVLRYVAAGGAVRVTGIDERSGPRPAARLIAGSSFQLVRVVISALSVVLPAITGLAAIAVLFATQALLTAILIPIGIGYALLMGRIQRRTLRDVEHRIEANRNSRRDTVQMLHALERQRFPAGGEPRWLVDYPERSWLSISLDAYRSVIFAKRRVGYLGELFQGISLLLILLVFGSVIASRGASWTVLLTYAVALGYAVRSLSSASRFVTAANRALPKVRRYLAFLRSSPDLATAGRPRIEAFGADWPSLAVAEPALPGSRDRVALRPGEAIFCIHPAPLGNASLETFCLALASGDPRLARTFESELFTVQGLGSIPERRFAEYLPPAADREAQWRDVQTRLEALGVGGEAEALGVAPDRLLAIVDEERASASLRLALRLLPGFLSSRRLFALDHETFALLDHEPRRRLLAALADRVVLITASRAPERLAQELATTLVVDAEAVRGIGDVAWFEAIGRSSVADWGEAPILLDAAQDDGLVDDDADDDEE